MGIILPAFTSEYPDIEILPAFDMFLLEGENAIIEILA